MRKRLRLAAASVVLLAAAPILFASQTVQAAETVTMGSSSNPNEFKFVPGEITVPVGTTVVWRNLSDIPHDATARNNSFKSPQLTKGQEFSFTFNAPGDVPYYCSVQGHEDAGMVGVVKVTGSGAPTAAPTPPTQAASSTTTATTAAPQPSTTTTTRAGVSSGPSSTTTTTAGGGATSTTQAPSLTPTSAPDTSGETSTTTAAGHVGEESAATDHASEGGSEKKEHKKNSPIGIAFASVSTVLLVAIAGKLLASKP